MESLAMACLVKCLCNRIYQIFIYIYIYEINMYLINENSATDMM
jgi:hypothetical protein